MSLGPLPAAKMFGIDNPTPASVEMIRRTGAAQLCVYLISYALIFNNLGVNSAIGLGLLPMMACVIAALLNDNYDKTGMKKDGDIAGLVVFGSAVLANLFKVFNWASTETSKIASIFVLLGGLSMTIDHSIGSKMWFNREVKDGKEKAVCSTIGVTLLFAATPLLYLAFGDETQVVTALLRALFVFSLVRIYINNLSS